MLLATFLVAGSLLMAGCDSLLQEEPASAVSADQFYQTREDAIAGVNAAYSGLFQRWGMYYRGIYLLVDLPTDDATTGQGVNNPNIVSLDNYTYTTTNDRVSLFWESTYGAINQANEAIANVPEVDMEEGLRTRLVAEARFLRGLYYFNLVRLFGGVPLVTTPTNSLDSLNVGRATVEATYGQIIEDLQFAEADLPPDFEGGDTGRATRMAAKGLLAKVYLTREQWTEAAQKAEEVIDAGVHELLPSYRDVFRVDNNQEMMFVVQAERNDGIGFFGVTGFIPRNVIPGVPGGSYDIPREAFYETFQEGGVRRDVTFFTSFTTSEGETVEFDPRWFKYVDPGTLENSMEMDSDYPILRYADVLLMYAEAVNEQGGPTPLALERLNKVRRRAFGEALDTSSEVDYPSGMSQAEFREALHRERRLEFGVEAHRRFDLVRWGRLQDVLGDIGIEVTDHRILYPIPQREMDTNPSLEQNPGY